MQTLIYARVSKSDGSQDVERQLVELREFAKKQNWQVVEEDLQDLSHSTINHGYFLCFVITLQEIYEFV